MSLSRTPLTDGITAASQTTTRWWHKSIYWFVICIYLVVGISGFGFEIWKVAAGQIPKARELMIGFSLLTTALALFSIMGSVGAYRLITFFQVISTFFSTLGFIWTSLANLSFDWIEVIGVVIAILIAYGLVHPATRAYARKYPKLVGSTRAA
jgi:hypothetical protein